MTQLRQLRPLSPLSGRGFVPLMALLALLLFNPGCKRSIVVPTENAPADKIRTVVATPKDRAPSPGQAAVLGTGWYANVEIDSQGRAHYAWVDADLGDVFYAMGPTGSLMPEAPILVEERGAVGSYLRLALAPGDVPVLSYYHQDDMMLRIAHRVADEAKMKAAGADVAAGDGGPPPAALTRGMGKGWVAEDVAFGDHVGLAGQLRVDEKGRPHVSYYTKGERLRYARRPLDKPAFGPGGLGAFEAFDVDLKAGASHTMSTGLEVGADGRAIISYCHWNYVDSQLKLGVLGAGKKAFQVVALPMQKDVDGWHSALLPVTPTSPATKTQWDVFSVATGEQQLTRFTFDARAPAVPADREVLLERPGPMKVARSNDGTIWVLTRGQGFESLDESPGVWLVKLPQGDKEKASRLLLERGLSTDPWLDLDILPSGRPIAVWTDKDRSSMKVYIH